MKIILTGGGSAGHVTPNIALLPYLQKDGNEIKYIGSYTGIEKDIVAESSLPYYGISSGKLRRYFNLKNFSDPFRIIKGYFQAKKILKKEKPDVIFSKGGFVSVPVVFAAHRLHIPVAIHESDYTPGLANRLAIPKATKVCFSFSEAAENIDKTKAIVTGAPIRDSLLQGSKEKGLEFLGFNNGKPVLMIMGGSLGALSVNLVIDEILDYLLEKCNVVHLRGKDKLNPELEGKEGYRQFEYINAELSDVFAATDYIISRSGSNAIFEFLALKKPSLLIPLPLNASRGDQILNAGSFTKKGYSLTLKQEDMTNDTLKASFDELLSKAPEMLKAMEESPISDGARNISEVILKLGENK